MFSTHCVEIGLIGRFMMRKHLSFYRLVISCIVPLALAVSLSGCDSKKEERETLRRDLEKNLSSLANVERQIQDTDSKLRELDSEIAHLKNETSKNEAESKRFKEELANYVLNHKAASLAVAATTAGVAGVLSENLTEQERGATAFVGVAGGVYCLVNSEECADAMTRIPYLGGQIAYHNSEAKKHSDRIAILQEGRVAAEAGRSPLVAERTKVSKNIDVLRLQIESLRDVVSPAALAIGMVVLSVLAYAVYQLKSKNIQVKDVDKIQEQQIGTSKYSAWIRGVDGVYSGNKFPIDRELVFGRDPQSCSIVFPKSHDGIGRRHCMVKLDDATGRVHLRDLGSANGTYFEGRRLSGNESVALHDGDEFYIFRPEYSFAVVLKDVASEKRKPAGV